MGLHLLTFGEALVEIMRPDVDMPLDQPGTFTGPYPSGAPFIFAVQAARLGARVGAIGCVGAEIDGTPDGFARCLLDQLRADGVDTSAVLTLAQHTTGAAFVAYRKDGGRDFIFHLRHAAAGQLAPSMIDQPQIAALFNGLKCLHLMGSSLSMHDDALALGTRMLEQAQASGAKISFDPNLRPQLMSLERAKTVFAPFAAAADVILPTVEEAMLLTGAPTADKAAVELLGDKSGRIVILKRGEHGCSVFSQTGRVDVPGFIVQEIDPTGAGDCFDAGFLTHWLRGDTPVEAARWANACGALAVTKRGPMEGAATAAQVQTFINVTQQRI